jgi:thiol-disulfide isomerase/thioredoxin
MLYQVRAFRVLLVLVLGLAAIAGCGSNSQGGNGGDKAGGLVTLEVLKVDEIQSLLASHKDKKVVVVDYWSTSCEPCMKEFPGLVKLSEKYPDEVACISVSLDFEGGKNKTPEMVADKVQKFLASQKATKVKNILSGTPSDEVMAAPGLGLDNGSPPLVLVYARDGSLAKKFDNSGDDHFTYADIEKLVAELLAKK